MRNSYHVAAKIALRMAVLADEELSHKKGEHAMADSLGRRDFFKGVGVGTVGLGFGVSVFEGTYQRAEAVSEVTSMLFS